MRHLGVSRAHVVGHSCGGAIALQLAVDAPDAVHSLALLEPALMMVPSAPRLMEALGPVLQMYAADDNAGAVDGFLRAVIGPQYRSVLDRVLPDSQTVWPGWVEIHQLIQDWWPRTEPFVLSGATHGLQLMNPHDLAGELASYFARHSLRPLPRPRGADREPATACELGRK